MATIKDLQMRKQKLLCETEELAKEILKKEEEKHLKNKEKYTVKVVCHDCEGTGYTCIGGNDIISDPPMEVDCDTCCGDGFLAAVPFVRRKKYDMKYCDL